MLNIRLPNITGKTPEEQIEQIRSYLYYLAQELQFALNTDDAEKNTKQENK